MNEDWYDDDKIEQYIFFYFPSEENPLAVIESSFHN